jgi:hypothetical protein
VQDERFLSAQEKSLDFPGQNAILSCLSNQEAPYLPETRPKNSDEMEEITA